MLRIVCGVTEITEFVVEPMWLDDEKSITLIAISDIPYLDCLDVLEIWADGTVNTVAHSNGPPVRLIFNL